MFLIWKCSRGPQKDPVGFKTGHKRSSKVLKGSPKGPNMVLKGVSKGLSSLKGFLRVTKGSSKRKGPEGVMFEGQRPDDMPALKVPLLWNPKVCKYG